MPDIKLREKIIAKDAIICKTPIRQFFGLMFSRRKTLIFELPMEKKVRMHMMFVFYPIDVVLLNAEKVVVELRKSFKPFTLFFSENKAKYILELEGNSLQKKGVRLGDKISF